MPGWGANVAFRQIAQLLFGKLSSPIKENPLRNPMMALAAKLAIVPMVLDDYRVRLRVPLDADNAA